MFFVKLKDYLRKHHKTHLIFDFDKTLFQLLIPWEPKGNSTQFIRDKLIALDSDLYERYLNREISFSVMQNKYVAKYKSEVKKLIIENNVKFETTFFKGAKANEKLVDFVLKDRKYKKFIWSSNTEPIILKVFRLYNLTKKFEKIICRNNIDFLKPNPEGFERLYDPVVPKENYLMIGDKNVDSQAAEKAGIDFFLENFFQGALYEEA